MGPQERERPLQRFKSRFAPAHRLRVVGQRHDRIFVARQLRDGTVSTALAAAFGGRTGRFSKLKVWATKQHLASSLGRVSPLG